MRYRQKCALDQEIPITNYGIAIAYMQGILKRCVEMLPDVRKELDQLFFVGGAGIQAIVMCLHFFRKMI